MFRWEEMMWNGSFLMQWPAWRLHLHLFYEPLGCLGGGLHTCSTCCHPADQTSCLISISSHLPLCIFKPVQHGEGSRLHSSAFKLHVPSLLHLPHPFKLLHTDSASMWKAEGREGKGRGAGSVIWAHSLAECEHFCRGGREDVLVGQVCTDCSAGGKEERRWRWEGRQTD